MCRDFVERMNIRLRGISLATLYRLACRTLPAPERIEEKDEDLGLCIILLNDSICKQTSCVVISSTHSLGQVIHSETKMLLLFLPFPSSKFELPTNSVLSHLVPPHYLQLQSNAPGWYQFRFKISLPLIHPQVRTES